MNTASFTDVELRAIAASSATLGERFSGLCAPAGDVGDKARARTLSDWRRAAGDSDDRHFAAILADYGVDESGAALLLGAVELAPGTTLPAWAREFRRCFDALMCPDVSTEERTGVQNVDQNRWSGFLHPLARAASLWRDRGCTVDTTQLISAQAVSDLEHALVRRLRELLGGALDDALRVHRFLESGGFTTGGLVADSSDPRGTEAVQSFIPVLRSGGLKRLFLERPVLARLTAVIVTQWIDATKEFLERLDADIAGPVAALASVQRVPRRVERVEAGLSDPHRGGRTVFKVSFDTGITLAYKPKSLAADCAFHRQLAWLSERGAPASAGTVRTIDCGSYGWAVWATPTPCQTQDEVDTFFRRSGAFLCLLRVLRSTDLHYENVVAVGSNPVPVDLETIVQPDPPIASTSLRGAGVKVVRDEFWSESVARTGYLPIWATVPGGGAVLLGGLDGLHARIEGDHRLGTFEIDAADHHNLPLIDGKRASMADHADAVLDGYRAMFGFLQTVRADLLSPGGPLDGWDHVSVRFLARPTQQYAFLERRSLAGGATTDGARWSLQFDHLYRLSKLADSDTALAQLIHEERAALAQLDVPIFSAKFEGREIFSGDGRTVGEFFGSSCREAIAAGLGRLTDDALARDCEFIRQSIASSRMADPLPWAMAKTTVALPGQADVDPRPLEKDRCKAMAARLAQTLQSAAVRTGDATIWIGRTFIAADERAEQFAPIGKGYLSGTVGVALFLAVAASVEPRESVRQSLLTDVNDALWWSDHLWRYERILRRRDQPTDLGLAHGLGGTLYGLVAIGAVTGQHTLFDRAARIATWLQAETITADRNYSLFGGAAGLALGLAAVDAVRPGLLANQMDACRALLLDRSIETARGQAWPRGAIGTPMTGLMQGAAGIALGLARLPDPDGRSREVIKSVLAHEGETDRTAELGGAGGTDAAKTLDYCHGRAGRLVAHSEIFKALELGDCWAEEGRALAERLVGRLPQTDDLNHGTAGLVSAQAAAALAGLCEPGCAGNTLMQVLDNYDARGRLRLMTGEDAHNPGLANGLAGMGLALLHAAEPDAVANYAAFELPSVG